MKNMLNEFLYLSFSNWGKVKIKQACAVRETIIWFQNGWNQNRIIIKWSKFSVIIDIIFIHAWENLYLLIRKMCVFFSFWRHIQYLFQWKGENTDKKKSIFLWHPHNEFFLVLMPSWKWKLIETKSSNNIEKRIRIPPQVTKYPLFLRGVSIHSQSYFFVDKHTITSLKEHTLKWPP